VTAVTKHRFLIGYWLDSPQKERALAAPRWQGPRSAVRSAATDRDSPIATICSASSGPSSSNCDLRHILNVAYPSSVFAWARPAPSPNPMGRPVRRAPVTHAGALSMRCAERPWCKTTLLKSGPPRSPIDKQKLTVCWQEPPACLPPGDQRAGGDHGNRDAQLQSAR
jgi:hypothetical protein